MRIGEKCKNLLLGAMALTLTASVCIPVSAMPADIREAEEEDISHRAGGASDEGEALNGDTIDDTDLLEPVGDYYVATQAANVRSYPNGPIIGNLAAGESYHVLQRRTDIDWYLIAGFGENAYVYTDYLIPEEAYTGNRAGGASDSQEDVNNDLVEMDIMMSATANVNMREVPNGYVTGVLKKGTDIHVTGNVNDQSWYRCEYKGETVFIYDDYLIPDFPQTMAATHNVNVRTEPSLNGMIVASLKVGDRVKVSAEENGWYRFSYGDEGNIGYSYGNYLAAIE